MSRIRNFCSRCLWLALYAIPVVLGIAYVGGIQVRKLAVRALNEKLNVRVDIQNIHVSSILTLPNVGIELVNLRIQESEDMYPGDLARLGQVRIEFDLFEILKGNKEIKEISIHNGRVQIYEDADGNNYSIFKTQEDQGDENVSLNLKKIRIENCQIFYRNDDKQQFLKLRAYDLSASGSLDDARSDVTLTGNGYIEQVISGDKSVVAGKNFDLDLDLTARTDINSYQIRRGIIGLEQLYLNVSGDVLMLGDAPDLDLKLEGQNVDIGGLLSVLPYEQVKKIGEWNSTGILDIDGYIKGTLSQEDFPKVHISFGIDNGSVTHKRSDIKIHSISMHGEVNNSKKIKDDLALDLEIMNMKLPHSNLKGHLMINGFSSPALDLDVHGKLGLEDIAGLVPKDQLKKLKGQVNIDMTGLIPWSKEYDDFDYANVDVTGNIDCRDVRILLPEMDIYALNLKGHVNGNTISDCQLSSKLDENDVRFEGKINNWVGYIFSDKRLEIEGNLASQKLDLDTIISSLMSGQQNGPESVSSSSEEVSIDLGVNAKLNVAVQYFKWLDFNAEELNGRLVIEKDRIWTDQLRIQCFDGRAELLADVRMIAEGFKVNAHVISDKLDIHQIFAQFNDFGQNELTRDNLTGYLSADIDVQFKTDKAFIPISESVYVLTDIHITEGRLKNYEPMQALSKFVEVAELQDIAFSDIENIIEIKNQTIIIPQMDVRSNALNLQISGTHTFDNYMDYKIKISLTELLASRSGWIRKKREKKLEEGVDGGLAAFVVMRGTPDDLLLEYDKDAVKQKVKEEAQRERKQFYSDLKKEIKGDRITTSEGKSVDWDE